MYTWGYIKQASLAKLDLNEQEANRQSMLNRFPVLANEALTQICSTCKPKFAFAEFIVSDIYVIWKYLCEKYNVYNKHVIIKKPAVISDDAADFWEEYDKYYFAGTPLDMPEDFISFGDDVCYELVYNPYSKSFEQCELHDDNFSYNGYNKVIFKRPGTYYISYNARWYTFLPNITDSTKLDIPTDILDCLPSYIASQCYKIDDERKASIYRNEFEIAMSRIDGTNFKNTKTIKIEGDW